MTTQKVTTEGTLCCGDAIAKILGKSIRAIQQDCRRGKIPYISVKGGSNLFILEDVLRCIEERCGYVFYINIEEMVNPINILDSKAMGIVLGISADAVIRRCKRTSIPSYKEGGKRRFVLEDVIRYYKKEANYNGQPMCEEVKPIMSERELHKTILMR